MIRIALFVTLFVAGGGIAAHAADVPAQETFDAMDYIHACQQKVAVLQNDNLGIGAKNLGYQKSIAALEAEVTDLKTKLAGTTAPKEEPKK